MVNNLANLITIFRIIISPLVLIFLLFDFNLFAFIALLVAIISDWLDGFVARSLNIETKFGATMDPFADKVLTIPLLLYFAMLDQLLWVFVLPLIFRDIVMTYFRHQAPNESKEVLQASFASKLKTVFIYFTLILLIAMKVFAINAASEYYQYVSYTLNTLIFIALLCASYGAFLFVRKIFTK